MGKYSSINFGSHFVSIESSIKQWMMFKGTVSRKFGNSFLVALESLKVSTHSLIYSLFKINCDFMSNLRIYDLPSQHC
jgi:hypothetical protein